MKCGCSIAAGAARPVWRGAIIGMAPLCASCAWDFVNLLELNAEAVQFMKDTEQNAALAYGPTAGSA